MKGTLFIQSEYSLLESTLRLDDLFLNAKNHGYDFLALSDTNNLYAAYKFFRYAKKYPDIKPIIGLRLEIYHLDVKSSLLFYAKNQKGYQSLLILSSMVMLNDEKRLELDAILPFTSDLIVVTPGYLSDIDQAILNNDLNQAKKRLQSYQQAFNEFYLGLSVQSFQLEMKVAPAMYQIAEDSNVLLLPIHQTAYLEKKDARARDALIKIEDPKNERFDQSNLSFMSYNDLQDAFFDYPFVFENLEKVFKQVEAIELDRNFDLPSVGLKEGVSSKDYLTDLCMIGLKKRLANDQITHYEPYLSRLKYELSVIDQMGYNDYFLVVYDFVRYAKTSQIMVGPGRGSAAGSLVSYTLGITNVDPLKYDLLFERFLNPERISMPDIDLDFPDDKRDQVINYVKEKYGSNRVVSITTFGTFAYRSSIRDICRVLGYSPQETNRIVKIATTDKETTNKNVIEVLELAKQIEGLPRHTGTHAAGIIISNEDLRYIIPLQKGATLYQSQFEQSDLEQMGLLKIDFLGIRNLQTINNVLELVKSQKQMDIDINKIPLDDKKTFDLLSKADTLGVFQLESSGMRNVLYKLKPQEFEDIVAVLALFRPGPMDNIDEYIKRRHEKTYLEIDPSIDHILKSTYGFIVYQEQIMTIANTFAGYSLAEADLLRRGVSKKDHEILNKEREKFIKKSIENHRSVEIATKIYDYIVKFADYGFNRSHSVAYAIVAYQMAYLKANHFEQFISVLLTSVISNETQIKDYISEARQRKVKILPPNINESDDTFKPTKLGIFYPLSGIKGIGTQTVRVITNEREKGIFTSYDDFKKRMTAQLSDKIIEALIFSGALDVFGLNKQTLYENRKEVMDLYALVVSDIKSKTYDEYDLAFLIEKEKETLGFNLIMTPLMMFQGVIKKNKLKLLEDIVETDKTVKTIGYIAKTKVITTKNNKTMAFISVTDGNMTHEMTVFPEIYEAYGPILSRKDYMVFECNIQNYQGFKLILSKLYEIQGENNE
ncbi:DNA polymerase III alpha subunit [Paracholeplasma brassicae]|uniref:DNA-directed DNA polymerase n=1 Tax=Acholeplasma brassicae TaxID=61635 RepID=U4KPC9_9MOLU|nr:DNA polymerase III subunit alpha [Paracholeplasma brassicae]CCV66302.1 DNA polymerase III alpha subunit [Paracholeplasma brassicae]